MTFDMTPYRDLYPFESHFLDRGALRLHYLDEGQGPAVVCVHGNPSWSFYWRELVKALRPTCRCVVPDHMGCGLSDKPDDGAYDFRYRSRVDDLEALLDHCKVGDRVTLVLHDWGGAIGMGWAARHPERVARLVLLNTAAFFKPAGKALPWQLRLVRNTPLGSLAVLGCNAFAAGAVRTCVTRAPMDPLVARAFCAPYGTWHDRRATLRFVQDIPLDEDDPSYADMQATQGALEQFRATPTLICWGRKDFVFDDDFLAEWRRRLPDAEVHTFDDAGHYVMEDARDEIVRLVGDFFERHPLP